MSILPPSALPGVGLPPVELGALRPASPRAAPARRPSRPAAWARGQGAGQPLLLVAGATVAAGPVGTLAGSGPQLVPFHVALACEIFFFFNLKYLGITWGIVT